MLPVNNLESLQGLASTIISTTTPAQAQEDAQDASQGEAPGLASQIFA
jgi:hypothetical protein